MIQYFGKFMEDLHQVIKQDTGTTDSKIVFGTVMSVNPLSIRQNDTGVILPSKHFYMTENVIVKKVKLLVHRIYGQPKEVHFSGSADEISNAVNMLLYQENKKAKSVSFTAKTDNQLFSVNTPAGVSGNWSATSAIPPQAESVAGEIFDFTLSGSDPDERQRVNTAISAQKPEASLALQGTEDEKIEISQLMKMFNIAAKAMENVAFHVEFIEEDGNEFKRDEPQQNQTVAIEGVLHQSIKIDDIALMTSHNGGQKLLLHRIINRIREDSDYEMAIGFDTRLNDIPETQNIIRH